MNGTWTDVGTQEFPPQNPPVPPTYVNSDHPENSNRIGDGKFDHETWPSDVEVPVGRLDLTNLPWFYHQQNPPGDPTFNELALYKHYFDKDHDWRTGSLTAQSRALIDDHFLAFSQSPWRSFALSSVLPTRIRGIG